MLSCAPLVSAVSTVPDASPDWLAASQLQPLPTASILDWLLDQGSLTRRLTALAAGAFAVCPLQEGWQPLRADECLALQVAEDSLGWVREVYLKGQAEAWVFARSVAAQPALQASGFDLQLLGSRSLGELLFSDTAFQRGAIEVCHYPADYLPSAVRHTELWARRSCFRREQLKVLVAEVFLPALWQRLAKAPL